MSLLKRVLINIFFLFALIFLPWYIVFVYSALIIWKYELHEVLIWGFLADIFYSSAEWSGTSSHMPMLTYTYCAAILMVIIYVTKRRIRFYS